MSFLHIERAHIDQPTVVDDNEDQNLETTTRLHNVVNTPTNTYDTTIRRSTRLSSRRPVAISPPIRLSSQYQNKKGVSAKKKENNHRKNVAIYALNRLSTSVNDTTDENMIILDEGLNNINTNNEKHCTIEDVDVIVNPTNVVTTETESVDSADTNNTIKDVGIATGSMREDASDLDSISDSVCVDEEELVGDTTSTTTNSDSTSNDDDRCIVDKNQNNAMDYHVSMPIPIGPTLYEIDEYCHSAMTSDRNVNQRTAKEDRLMRMSPTVSSPTNTFTKRQLLKEYRRLKSSFLELQKITSQREMRLIRITSILRAQSGLMMRMHNDGK